MRSKTVEYGGKLTLVCVVCMLGVAGAYVKAKDRIEEGKQKAVRSAILTVLGLPADAGAPEVLNPDAAPEERVYVAEVEGVKRYATQGAQQGFSSVVVMAVGARFDGDDLRIIEARVISQNETPGLGTRIKDQETNLTLWTRIGNSLGGDTEEVTDWFYLKQFRGKGLDQLLVTGDPAEADQRIVKITGVTITTNATVAAVRRALVRIRECAR